MTREAARDTIARVLVFAVITTVSQGCATTACDSLCDHAERCDQHCVVSTKSLPISEIPLCGPPIARFPGGRAGDDCFSNCVDRYWERSKECRAAIRQFARCLDGRECVWPELLSTYRDLRPSQVEPACLAEWYRLQDNCLG
jgi:hypothetical protein